MSTPDSKIVISLETLLKGLDPTVRGLKSLKKELTTLQNLRPRDTAQNFNRTTQASARQAQQVRRLALASAELDARQRRLEASNLRNATAMERARLAAHRLERQKIRNTSTANSFDKSLNKIGNTLNRIGGGLQSFGRSLTIGLTAPLTALGLISAKSAKDIDAIRNRLIATEGSLEAANKRLADLNRLADESVGVTRGAAQDAFAALSVIGGITEKTINRQIKALGRLNAAFSIDDQPQFFRNLVQIFSQGFERADVKEALGRVPIFNQLLQSAFGTADAAKLKELKAAGKLTLDTFLAGLAGAVESSPVLAQIQESIGTRLAKTFERLQNALEPIGRALLDPLERLIKIAEPLILSLANAFGSLSPQVQTIIVAFGVLAAAAGPILIALGGIVVAVGGLITAITAIAGVVAAIGFPELLIVLAAVAVQITALAAGAFALFRAWQTNFLGIRNLVSDAAQAVGSAFNRIRAIFNEATQRILPTLQSITGKVLATITALWDQYGSTVVEIIGSTFGVVTRTIEAFLRFFGNAVDLILKLINSDWRGAWRAFSRIIINAIDGLDAILTTAANAFRRVFLKINAFILRQAFTIMDAASRLAAQFIGALAAGLIAGAPKLSSALGLMLLIAASGIAFGPIAQAIVGRLITEMRKAASDSITTTDTGPSVGAAPGGGAGIFRKKAQGAPSVSDTADKKAANALRKAQDDFEKAQNEFAQTQAENRLALTRAGIQQQLDLTKDGLDRELSQLESNFDERLVAVKKYFAERRRLEEASIDTELAKEKGLNKALGEEFLERRKQIEREFKAAVAEINRDPGLKGRAKEVSLKTAEQEKQTKLAKALNEEEVQGAEISTRILLLQRKRKDVTAQLTREEQNLLKELEKQETELSAQLLEDRGLTVDSAAVRLRQQFKDTIESLRVDVTSLAPELQTALNSIDLQALKSRLNELPQPVRDLIDLLEISFNRAVIQKQAIDVERTLAELQIQESAIQNKVLDGVLTERDARAAILGIQQITRDRLLDILAAQLKIAEATQGQEDEVLRIRAQIDEIRRLGNVIDEVGQQINQELFSDIGQGLEGFFQNARRGFEGLKDAAISFGESLLNTLNKIATQSILDKLEGIFKPDATNTTGTPGGFLAKIFGVSPKPADAATGTALTTAATTAGTALTTGATTAATALTTGAATASASIVTGLTAAATSFAAAVTAAGAAFAATVAASSAGQAIGGLGGALGAASGMFPAVPGGMVHIVEGGYPEAVLTTDPKYANRQVQILKAYLKQTKGLFGRIPKFEAGGMITPRQTELDLLDSLDRSPSVLSGIPDGALANGGGGTTELKLRQILTTEDMVENYLNSPQGETVIIDKLMKNAHVLRRLTSRRN